MVGHGPCCVNHDLSKICNTSNGSIFDLMKFVPEILLDLVHIAPEIHSVCFNICDLFLVCCLLIFVTIDILSKVCIFRSLNNNRSNLLRGFDLLDLLLKPLCNNLRNRHVVNFRWCLNLSSSNRGLIRCWSYSTVHSTDSSWLYLLFVITLDVQSVHFLTKLLGAWTQVSLQKCIILELSWLLLYYWLLISDLRQGNLRPLKCT